MSGIQLKKLRLGYKISLVSAVMVFLIGVFSVIFLLLPIYSLVGEDTSQGISESDNRLSRAKIGTTVALGATYTLITVSLVSAGYGVYQDVRSKSKN